jgi:hypothetical protein
MSSSILRPFQKFPHEGAVIGRLLAGYSTLEIDLMNCVQVARGDFDTVLKAMFRIRGEKDRIDKAEGLGLDAYRKLGLEADFLSAITAMRRCLVIRNAYAHWIWWDDNSGLLAFANVEDIAKTKTVVKELAQLNPHHVDNALLAEQEAYFVYVDQYLAWVNHEGRFLSKTLERNSTHKPPTREPPALSVELKARRLAPD